MEIGFFIKWSKGTLNTRNNVLGDELYAEAMCKSLRAMDGIESAELYCPDCMPAEKLDVLIYLNDIEPITNLADKHVLYMQNAYGEGSEEILKRFHSIGYDGYAFISNKILDLHRKTGRHGIFLPFGVDTGLFNPRPHNARYAHEVAYIGNDIKGKQRTTLYLYPATRYDFGLYGNWRLPSRFRFWRNLQYQRAFSRISRGKIPQEDVPILYSSAKINLNCTAQDCVDWDVITLRTLEVLACKGFLISDKVAIAEEQLHAGVVFTDGGEDLVNKIEYYLARPKERQEIAECGYAYAIKHATIGARMKELYNYLGEVL
jgi:Uncharacterized protein conserved in bacteria